MCEPEGHFFVSDVDGAGEDDDVVEDDDELSVEELEAGLESLDDPSFFDPFDDAGGFDPFPRA